MPEHSDNHICGSLLLASRPITATSLDHSSAPAVTHRMHQMEMNDTWTMPKQSPKTTVFIGRFDASIVIEASPRLLSKPTSIHILP
jgi:hypothetical protein